MIKRTDIINHLIDRCGYEKYLEIGVSSGQLFKRVKVRDKMGVDPAGRWWYRFDSRMHRTTSDRFFEENRGKFDLVFVDGLHEADQAYRDIRNALDALLPGGAIVMHDCLPVSKEQQAVPRIQRSWTGDVWRAFVKVSLDPGVTTVLLDTDHGCGVILPRPRPSGARVPPPEPDPLSEALAWETFDQHKSEWLTIVPPDRVYEVLDELTPAKPAG